MSDRPPDEIKATVPGDWAYVYACFMTLRKLIAPYPQYQSGAISAGTGYTATVYHAPNAPNNPIGTIEITRSGSETDISAQPTTPEYAEYWRTIVKHLQNFAGHRRLVAPTADELIEAYYRSGVKTLRAFAEEFGYNYDALRKHKQRYDAAGKWGAKRHRSRE